MIFISDHNRSSGTLIGLAIGDALGAPLEGLPAPREWVTTMLPGGRYPRGKGEVTDDTLQALAIAETLITCHGFDPDYLMGRLIARYKTAPHWFGPTSKAVFDLVMMGVPPRDAAGVARERFGVGSSNGGVVRGFPIGVFYPPVSVSEVSIACSLLTHDNMVAAHCSAWLNLMVSSLCRGSLRKTAFMNAGDACRSQKVFDRLGRYENFVADAALDALSCAHAALSCFMNAYSFEEAVLLAINLGGDADTVGACCGALAGAYWGADAIPERWIRDLQDYDNILSIAGTLSLMAKP